MITYVCCSMFFLRILDNDPTSYHVLELEAQLATLMFGLFFTSYIGKH
jgi:hypothetical protein